MGSICRLEKETITGMTAMDCPSENATLPKCNQRLDTVVVTVEDGERETNGSLVKQQPPVVSCLRKPNTPNKHKRKHKDGVKFVEFITVTECLHFLDYSKKEFKGTWYTEKEMAKSRDEYRFVLEQANAAGGSLPAHFRLLQDESSCLRGLEYKTPMGYKRREQNRRVAWQAVEREQYRQWDQGFKDILALREEYQLGEPSFRMELARVERA